MPKNVGDFGKLSVAKGFEKLPESPIIRPIWSHYRAVWFECFVMSSLDPYNSMVEQHKIVTIDVYCPEAWKNKWKLKHLKTPKTNWNGRNSIKYMPQ